MLDQVSNRHFLVDTGASYSILPHVSSLPASCPKLYGPAGQPLPCWGERLVQLRFQDLDFSWKFLVANVAFPILGVDFLRAHKLLIDPVDNALLDSTGRRLAGQLLHSPPTATVVVGPSPPPLPPPPLRYLHLVFARPIRNPCRTLRLLLNYHLVYIPKKKKSYLHVFIQSCNNFVLAIVCLFTCAILKIMPRNIPAQHSR
jgi:hypothetical protein